MAKNKAKMNKFLTGAITATMVATAVAPTAAAADESKSKFTDISGYAQETQDKINALVDAKIINGTSETTFSPTLDIKRGQVVKLLGRYLVESGIAEVPANWDTKERFKDVPVDFQDADLVKNAAVVFDAGVFQGNNGSLDAAGDITRQNMALVLDRAAEAITGTSLVELSEGMSSNVSDLETAKAEAREAIKALNALGLSTVREFKPAHNVTRANFATFLYNAIEVIEEVTEEVGIESVKAINPTTIQVKFDGDITEDQAKKDNYSLSKGEIEAVKVEGKVATLSVKGLTYGDKTTVSVADPTYSAEVTVPEVSELYVLDVTTDAADDTIKSDGAAKTQVTVTLRDKATGEVVKEDGIVQFQATRGGLGQTTSALQDGKATVQLTSVASATSLTSIVTATVSDVPGAAEFEGLTAQKAVIFSPDAKEAETKFVQALAAESTQGDRLHVQFSDKISAEAYKKAIADRAAVKGKPTTLEYGIVVDGKIVAVKDVIQLTENTLEFILDVDHANPSASSHQRIEQTNAWTGVPVAAGQKNYLRDNVTHTVSFPQNIGGLVLSTTTGLNFILTDTSRPAVLGVTAKDQLNFTVRFTESVDERTVENAPENFLLDGRKVKVIAKPTAGDIATAKANNEIILTSLKVNEYYFQEESKTADAWWKLSNAKAVDARNLIDFKVHKDFALAGGVHQIQVANVGDWAQDVDPVQNKVATDTFDFTVSVDNSVPVPVVEVQSAEQWKVSFDKDVYGSTGKTIKDVFAVKSADSNDTFEMATNALTDGDYIVSYINADGTTGKQLNPNDPASELDGQKHFLIEFTKDWTVKYDTNANALKTYFASTKNPYTVTVQNLESAIGNKMAKQELDVKLSYDGVSPTIDDARQLEVNGALTSDVRVKMSEPVKNVGGNNEGLTPSQDQTAGTGIPQPTYEFVKGDKVVKATAKDASYDNYGFTLTPDTDLEPGEWTLYIRSISDDIGNTSATVSQVVNIVKADQAATKTQVAWAAFDDAAGGNKLVPGNASADNDVVYVKFTKEMKADGANGVSRTQNYVFRGQPLPAGSQVVKGIQGVTTAWDGVTIIMPKGTWDGVDNNQNDFGVAFNVANNFTSADGEALSGAYEVELKDTNTNSGTLANGFEGLYKAANSGTFGNVQATITGATAFDTNANGKVDQVVLGFEESVTLNDKTEIRVNGKTFVISGNTVGTSATFNAKDFPTSSNNEIDGTTTTGLQITSVDGAILINKDSVVDKVAPIVKAAELSGGKLKVTFSESIDVTASPVAFTSNLQIQGGSTVTFTDAEEIGSDYLVFGIATGSLNANATIDVISGGSTQFEDKHGNKAIEFEGATTTNDVKITGITGTPGAVQTGVTATSTTMTQTGITNVPAGAASASAIGDLSFGGFTDNALAGYQIKLVEATPAVSSDDTAAATLNVANKEITVTAQSLLDVTATNIENAIKGLNTTFTGVGLTAEATAINTVTASLAAGGSFTAGTSTITAGTAGVSGQVAKGEFKVVTGASKTGNVTVTITETIPGSPATNNVYTITLANQPAGTSASAIATAIAGGAITPTGAAPTANFGLAVDSTDNTKLVITQTTGGPATYTVTVQ